MTLIPSGAMACELHASANKPQHKTEQGTRAAKEANRPAEGAQQANEAVEATSSPANKGKPVKLQGPAAGIKVKNISEGPIGGSN
ncbi:MAG: hypothetical protein HYV03_02515 [Deltaproteobacteria bacterium]|nr:hypothetical protein [Deltaproteobacteria bacterium]